MSKTETIRVEFERIGRNRGVKPLEVQVVDSTSDQQTADAIAYAVHKYAGKHLASRDYTVTVDVEDGTGSIGAGRFGTFTLHEVEAS